MNAGKAVLAGAVGGLAMTALGWLVRLFGLPMNAEMMLGTMVVAPAGAAAWLAGFAIHMLLSVLIALAYAWGFEHVAHRAGVGAGLAFGVVHIVIAGMVMGMVPAMHPMIPEMMPAPGAFMAAMGTTFLLLFILEHFMYAAIVGGMYGPVKHPRERILTPRPASTARL